MSGYTFSKWTSADGVTFANPNSAATTFTMPAKDVTVTATWQSNGGSGGGGGAASKNASISSGSLSFAKNGGTDVTVTMNSGSYALSGLKNGSYTLQKGVDYTVSGNTITISANYLSTLPAGTQSITVDMNGGKNPVLTITITDTGTPANPTGPTKPTGPSTPTAPQPGKQTGQPANPFVDVHSGDWFYSDVMCAYGNGLMTGTNTEPMRFSPSLNLTRSMIVTILYRESGSPDASNLANPFSDVANGQWYTDAVKWAAANHIVSGVSSGKYAPNAPITRQDLAVILARYAQYAGIQLSATRDYPSFLDSADIAGYAQGAVSALFKAGMISGYADGSFHPTGEATRAEVAAMLHRFLAEAQG